MKLLYCGFIFTFGRFIYLQPNEQKETFKGHHPRRLRVTFCVYFSVGKTSLLNS